MKIKFTNITIQNRSKQKRLNTEHVIPAQCIGNPSVTKFLLSAARISLPKEQILYSLGCQLLGNNDNPAVKSFLNDYRMPTITLENIPFGEYDLLGTVYQYLNTKRENLERGTFYTGRSIARDFVYDLDFGNNQTILDPSCGSGAFLFASNALPSQIFGVDLDPTAIMIAKFNYFAKFPNAPAPNLYCQDFFDWLLSQKDQAFDYVVGNPPYGANIDLSKIRATAITSGESFSYFIEFSYRLVKQNGLLRFLLPEAVLNVKRHADVRDFILSNTNLNQIKRYTKKFAGVMSDVYQIELDRNQTSSVSFIGEETVAIQKNLYKNLKNRVFVQLSDKDLSVIEKVMRRKAYDLSDSIFGLGVVTGDNRSKIFDAPVRGSEHIYTGKDVEKYRLRKPCKFIIFDRAKLQQVAPDEIYRAPKKLVYKTISKFLKVAIDTNGSLTSNSANIIIPSVREMDIYVVMALLNSDLYSYLHLKLFGGVNKIAKENLMALPFPNLSNQEGMTIRKLVMDTMEGGSDEQLQNYIHEDVFHLTNRDVTFVRGFLPKAKVGDRAVKLEGKKMRNLSLAL